MRSKTSVVLVAVIAAAVIVVGAVRVATHRGASSAAAATVAKTTPTKGAAAPRTAVVPAPVALTEAQLEARLLSISDFPTGWRSTPVTPDDSSGTKDDCKLPRPAKHESAKVEVDFASGQTEELDEELDSYRGSAQAKSVYDASVKYVSSCTTLTESDPTVVLTGGQENLPTIGTASFAFEYTGSVQGFNISDETVFILAADTIIEIDHSDLGQADTDTTIMQAQRAYAKDRA